MCQKVCLLNVFVRECVLSSKVESIDYLIETSIILVRERAYLGPRKSTKNPCSKEWEGKGEIGTGQNRTLVK